MPSIVPGDAHLNQFLTDYSVAFRPQGMIASEILPVVNVGKQTNAYAIYDKSNWLRRPTTNRAPGQEPNNVRYSVSSDTYYARNYALGTDVWYETQANADPPHKPLQDGVEFLRDQLALDWECRAFTKVSGGVGSSQTLTGDQVWSDFGGSDPTAVIRTARAAVRATTGYLPNVAIVPWRVLDTIQYHPDLVRAAFPGAGVGGMVDTTALAKIMGVDKVLVPKAIQNTGTEGLADSFTDVWSTNVYLLYVAANPGLMTPTFGLSFHWNGGKLADGGPANFQVYQEEKPKASRTDIWTGYYQDEKIVSPELGFGILTGI